MIDPVVGALLAGSLALLFASAALHKLQERAHFAAVFAAYEVLPPSFVRMAPAVPLLELLVALGLLMGGARSGAASAGAALLLTYAGVIAINLARGRSDLSCGCGGPNDRRPIAPWMVWRNLVLASLLGVTCLPWAARPLSAADALTIGAGTAVAALLYISLDALMGRPRAAWERVP
jgi:methylamine utilization protein MauE